MTKEEAIKVFLSRGYVEVEGGQIYDGNAWRTSCIVISEMLKEQQLYEDCVSRQAVLNTLDTTDKFLDEDRTVESYKALLKECYEVLPPTTPTRKKCKWIYYIDEQGWSMTYPVKCSNCNTRFTWSNYCPNCGAEMEKGWNNG